MFLDRGPLGRGLTEYPDSIENASKKIEIFSFRLLYGSGFLRVPVFFRRGGVFCFFWSRAPIQRELSNFEMAFFDEI